MKIFIRPRKSILLTAFVISIVLSKFSFAQTDLCTGAPGIISIPAPGFCTPGTLPIGTTYTAVPGSCGGANNDVWFKFVAQSTNPIITYTAGTLINGQIQLFSGACGGLTSISCGTLISATGLTTGNTYYIRIYSTSNATGTFTVCITDPPANDLCANAVTLTSGTTCTNTSGNVVDATISAGTPLPICGTPVYDVWYKFVAASTVQTVTLSSPGATGANFIDPGIQLLSGACGSQATVACATGTTLTAGSLTIGTTYYVRIYSTSAAPTSNGAFNICVTTNDLCSAAVPITSAPAPTCNNTPGTLVGATNVALPNTCAALTGTRKDVWYAFTAQTTNPTINVSSGPANSLFQVFSGGCGSLASVFCSTTNNQATSGLTIGTPYLVRVYSNTDAAGTFNICITDPAPANDLCAGAVTLNSATTCTNVTGTMYVATLPGSAITADCAGAVVNDVWYKFVAQTSNPTITLSSLGVSFTNPGMELITSSNGACGGTLTAVTCGTTSIAAKYLTPGTTYFIRVYSTSGTAPSFAAGSFNICVVDPVSGPPSNDECANAVNLSVANVCSVVSNPGNMAGATPSSQPLNGSCAGPLVYDVWYRFTAVSTSTVVTLGSLGANFLTPGIEVFSGNCAGLTSIACGTNPLTVPGLTSGSTCYVRVYSTTPPPPNGNARFTICLTSASIPVVRFGNSYVNVSKKTNGGVVQPGDTLEIRMTINHTTATTMSKLRFVDNIPSKTNILAASKINIITNEGLTYKQYTQTGGDDAATFKASPGAGEYNIRMNLGFGGSLPGTPVDNTATESASAVGTMLNTNKPTVFGSALLFAVAYRVVVTGVPGDTVVLSPAMFMYNDGTDQTLTATPYKILISNPLTLCANSIGLNNAVEYGGTFGAGAGLNRGSDLTTPIAGYDFVNDVNAYNSVGDGRYAIVNNISPRSDPIRTARRVPNCNVPSALTAMDLLNCNNRMHGGHWYIDGDHTGTSNATGNVPPDATTPSGYMLEVNADYVASEVYRQTVSNLCPNTYYEFSAWVRNICPTCGADSVGAQFAGTPTAPANGYPGVLPNLTFTLNNLDYYNTGEIDTVGWLKKGFVFKTGPNQNTATFSIRNNAQGGGGNDWVLDDIAVATCLPSMMYSPSINPAICQGNSLQINDTVRSYFDNYTHYKWQRSTDGGNNWSNVTTNHDTTLTLNGSIYQFMTSYTIPAANTTLADSGDLYRVVVATLDSNLFNPACLFTDASTIITLKVLDCGVPLGIDFISFSGKLDHGNADLIWTTSKESEPVSYSVERSYDGTNFSSVGMLPGQNNPNAANNTYKFTDFNVQGTVWYRIAIINKDGHKKYSRIIILDDKTINFGLTSVINPFSTKLDFGIMVSENSRVDVTLINISGKPVRKESFSVYDGANSLTINATETLTAGMYILQIRNKDQIINKKVMKK